MSHTRFAVFLDIDLEISRICMFFSGFQQGHASRRIQRLARLQIADGFEPPGAEQRRGGYPSVSNSSLVLPNSGSPWRMIVASTDLNGSSVGIRSSQR